MFPNQNKWWCLSWNFVLRNIHSRFMTRSFNSLCVYYKHLSYWFLFLFFSAKDDVDFAKPLAPAKTAKRATGGSLPRKSSTSSKSSGEFVVETRIWYWQFFFFCKKELWLPANTPGLVSIWRPSFQVQDYRYVHMIDGLAQDCSSSIIGVTSVWLVSHQDGC